MLNPDQGPNRALYFPPRMQNYSNTNSKLTSAKPRGAHLVDPTSHYYLKTADYGPLILNNILQGNSNYYPWNRELTTILITMRKLGFVLGQFKEPNNKNYEEYEAGFTCHEVIRQ